MGQSGGVGLSHGYAHHCSQRGCRDGEHDRRRGSCVAGTRPCPFFSRWSSLTSLIHRRWWRLGSRGTMVLIPDEGTCNNSNSDPHLSPPASQVLPGHIAFCSHTRLLLRSSEGSHLSACLFACLIACLHVQPVQVRQPDTCAAIGCLQPCLGCCWNIRWLRTDPARWFCVPPYRHPMYLCS